MLNREGKQLRKILSFELITARIGNNKKTTIHLSVEHLLPGCYGPLNSLARCYSNCINNVVFGSNHVEEA